jgi:hypothetical protein
MQKIPGSSLAIPHAKRLAACMAVALALGNTAASATDEVASHGLAFGPSVNPSNWSPRGSREASVIDSLSNEFPSYLGRWPAVTSPVPSGAAPLEVANCDDSGAGSLRATVAAATSGDTVDLSQLPCSTITLTSGAISFFKTDLNITGPGASSFAIDGGGKFSIFRHAGTGTLSVSGLTLTNGYLNQYYGHGGCVFSQANVNLQNVTVSSCVVQGGYARGGGIFAVGNLTLVNTLITGNTANGEDLTSSGGGFLVGGTLLMQNSTLSNNAAVVSPTGQFAVAGGADTFGNVVIQGSTISGNQAINVAAIVFEAKGTQTAMMINSTVSGNIATFGGPFGSLFTSIPLTIYNSTIAFNTGTGCGGLYAAYARVTLQSSILAGNSVRDLGLVAGATVVGANNLISQAASVPAGTIRACPRLLPLADNGGVTLTHVLLQSSPAIDMGNNTMSLANDQRGIGFPRVFGATADIGAFEWQGATDDRIFNSGFEFTCDL